jgi:hypothetical protein
MVRMDIATDLAVRDAPRLLEPGDFTRFKVVVRGGGDREAARQALASVARWLDDEHVAVSADAVRAMAGDEALKPEWQRGFAAMLAYAGQRGWMVGDAIRAHVEWES